MASVVAAWPTVALGEVLALDVDAVPVDPSAEYRIAGVYSFGRGLLTREPLSGAQTTYKVFHRLHTDQFVLSQLKAWEGALARVPTEFDGWFLSPQFPTFRTVEGRLDVRYLDWYCKQAPVWEQLRNSARGMGARRDSVSPSRFLSLTIPLPPLDEQRRIVGRIEALVARIEQTRGLRSDCIAHTDSLWKSAAESAFQEGCHTAISDFAVIQSGYAFQSEWFSDDGVRLVRNVNVGHGSIVWEQVARLPERRRADFIRFELTVGDIVISLDRPIISTGVKIARVSEIDVPSLLLQRVGRVQFRANDVLPDYLYAWLRSPRFVNAIAPGRSNGVPHISPKDIERLPLALPSLAEQRRVVAYLDDMQARVDTLKRLQAETAAELDALLPAVLDQAFRGEL